MCLAQGHNTVMPIRIEPATPQSPVKHSTNEPLSSLIIDAAEQVNHSFQGSYRQDCFKDFSRTSKTFLLF